VLLDEAGIARRSNIVRHGSLEFTLPPEHHQRNQLRFVDAKKFLKSLGVTIVLVKRVLEAVFFSEQALGPLSALLVGKYPAIHVLGLDNEDAKLRDDDVVDLRRAIAGLKRNVVQRDVDFWIEQELLGNCADSFSDPTLDERF